MKPSHGNASTAGAAGEFSPRIDPGAARPAADSADGLKGRIRDEARALGFDAIGFARAGESRHAQRLRAWLRAGRHGTMGWIARNPERRSDPRAVLQGARTVISVSLPYYRGDWPTTGPGAPPRGRIARYAWGRDYHKRIRRRLRHLAHAIGAMCPDARWLAYVDTGPMLDRAWAEEAGIGWIGKNTNLIRKGAGSWFFLGEILTDLALEPDVPARNYCGTCARCITACPTGAIVGPYQLDARRCISYLTIEHRGAIPADMRPLIGSRIFGCDDCQEVCPWNRFAVETQNPDFAERPDQQTPHLIPLLFLDDDAFRARFQGTAILRAKRSGFVRNVAVALGNLGDRRSVEPLSRALARDPDPVVRGHAAWALGRIGGRSARATLRDAAKRETSRDVLVEIRAALAEGTAAASTSSMEGERTA
ncbi:MAG: tRNA epoxyqueuosine(34) reductase QueG [Candidatus Eisenbacteria bacterium]|uniref:Epoxyqueuosine reductase n=1 Tax=Eiseniibacteriota bacterium TaxID=2212470 RepID=A0A538T4J0_UNCEI|nr:MAG: tRNA epoxyqueuosine(34) reductase QueG [Candidatus Eisenbacteria bacterium]